MLQKKRVDTEAKPTSALTRLDDRDLEVAQKLLGI
jgi:hypothetical protein